MDTVINVELTVIKEFTRTTVLIADSVDGVCIVQAKKSYIPIDEFKEVFNYIGDELVSQRGIKKLVFDKRNLTVFHQPSMEWYFIEWKEKMFHKGLKIHRKILPGDNVFVESVKLGRQIIAKKHPNGKYLEMDIQYSETIEEAIAN